MTFSEELIGFEFYPTFRSNIEFYRVRGYDAERKMVLTKVIPRDGLSTFDDEIEEAYFFGAFENGDYEPVNKSRWEAFKQSQSYPGWAGDKGESINETLYIQNLPEWVDYPTHERKVIFDGECCKRCIHRFATTSNSSWCKEHVSDSRCYKFKFDKNSTYAEE